MVAYLTHVPAVSFPGSLCLLLTLYQGEPGSGAEVLLYTKESQGGMRLGYVPGTSHLIPRLSLSRSFPTPSRAWK